MKRIFLQNKKGKMENDYSVVFCTSSRGKMNCPEIIQSNEAIYKVFKKTLYL